MYTVEFKLLLLHQVALNVAHTPTFYLESSRLLKLPIELVFTYICEKAYTHEYDTTRASFKITDSQLTGTAAPVQPLSTKP
jgi:hypothetical protein